MESEIIKFLIKQNGELIEQNGVLQAALLAQMQPPTSQWPTAFAINSQQPLPSTPAQWQQAGKPQPPTPNHQQPLPSTPAQWQQIGEPQPPSAVEGLQVVLIEYEISM
jgi:hypothetical protein